MRYKSEILDFPLNSTPLLSKTGPRAISVCDVGGRLCDPFQEMDNTQSSFHLS